MQDQNTILLLPEGATGPEWNECQRTAAEDCPAIQVHCGPHPPLAHFYIRVSQPVLFAPGSIQALLHALRQGAACATPLTNGAPCDQHIAPYFADASLAEHPNNRFAVADHLSQTQKGRTLPLKHAGSICCASRSPTPFQNPAGTLVLDSFVYQIPRSVATHEDPMNSALSASQNQPGLCIWLHPDAPDLNSTLTNMAPLAGSDMVVLNATSAPLSGAPDELDVWSVSPLSTWNNLAPKLKRWFGDRNVLVLRAGLFALPQQWQQMQTCAPCSGPIENPQTGERHLLATPSSWNPQAPLHNLPWGWVVVNPAQEIPTTLSIAPDIFVLGHTSLGQSHSAPTPPNTPPPQGGFIPESVKPHLMGFQKMVVSGKGQTVDLSGNICPQEGCDSLLWKLEPTDLPGLAIHLRQLRLAGCRRLVLTFENNFFQTPHAPYAHFGCSPVDVRREVQLAGFSIGPMAPWEGCQTVPYQESYFNTTTNSQGWTEEEKAMATHSRLWFVADACSESLHTERKVSVVILALNKVEYTKKCIESIRANCQQNIELILVNNGSTDSTAPYFDSIPGAKVIHNSKNLGVAAGWNQGMRVATGEYILVLNNDTIVAPRTIENLVRCAVNHPQAGMVCPRSNQIAGPQMLEGFRYNSETEIPANALRIQQTNDLACWEFTPLKGFCMLIPAPVAREVGEFDERFGIGNFEDDDYCNRVYYHGYRLLVADDSFLFHFGSVSFDQANINWQAQMEKNQALFNAKWENGRSAAFEQSTMAAPTPTTFTLNEADLRAALAQDELNPELYYQLGQTLYNQGEIKQAFSNYCKSLECDPTNTQVAQTTMNLLKSHFSDAETHDVLQFLRRRFPFAKAFQNTSTSVSPPAAHPASAQALNQAGIEYYQQSQYAQAKDSFYKALLIESEPDTLLNYYDCCLQLNTPQEAKVYLEQGVKQYPKHGELLSAWQELMALETTPGITGAQVIYYRECNQAAEKYLQEGLRDKAQETLHQILPTQPSNYRAQNTQGLLLWYSQQFEQAIQAFEQSVHSNPWFTDAVSNLFDCAALSGSPNRAWNALQKALSVQPNHPELLDIQRHLQNGTYPEHLGLYANQTRNDHLLQGLIDKGNALLTSGDFNQATIVFTDLLAEYPDNVEALNGVGIAAYQRGTLDDARMLFAHALKIKPLDQDSLLNYWEVCQAQGRPQEAMTVLKNALDMDPTLSAVSEIVRTEGLV